MKRIVLAAASVGLLAGVWVQWGMVPTAWLFYEGYHATGIDLLYLIYTGLKAGGDILDWWPMHPWISLASALVVGAIAFGVLWLARRRKVRQVALMNRAVEP